MLKRLSDSLFFKGPGLIASFALLFVFIGSVGLDQVSKIHVHNKLLVWESDEDDSMFRGRKVPVFSLGEKFPPEGKIGLYFGLNMQYSRNKGAAFSMLSDLDDRVRIPLFYAITIIAVVLIMFYLRSTPVEHVLTRYGLILILSGAIGNFLDRLHRGYVVDFVDVDWNLFGWIHDFAIFNVADIAINIGVICLLLDMLIQHRNNPPPKTKAPAAA